MFGYMTALFGKKLGGGLRDAVEENIKLALIARDTVFAGPGVTLRTCRLLSCQDGDWFSWRCRLRQGRLAWVEPERLDDVVAREIEKSHAAGTELSGPPTNQMFAPYVAHSFNEDEIWAFCKPKPNCGIPEQPSPSLKVAFQVAVNNEWPVRAPANGLFVDKRSPPSWHWAHNFHELKVLFFKTNNGDRFVPVWGSSRLRVSPGSRVEVGNIVVPVGDDVLGKSDRASPERMWHKLIAKRDSYWRSAMHKGAACRLAFQLLLAEVVEEHEAIDLPDGRQVEAITNLVPSDVLGDGIADAERCWVADEIDPEKPEPRFMLEHLTEVAGPCLYRLPDFRPAGPIDNRLVWPGDVSWQVW